MRATSAILSNAYRCFLAVAEAGSIRAAARELNVVSSAVNRQVLMLEDGLGIRLFDRVGRGLKLSEAGTLLLRQVRDTVDRHDDVVAELDTLRGLKRGRVRIATVESIAADRLPRLLAGFWRLYPGIETTLTVTGGEEVPRLVADNAADVGFAFSTHPLDGVRIVHREPHALGAVLAPGHRLAGAATLRLDDLADEPLLLPARGLSLRSALDPALLRAGRRLSLRGESDSLRLTAALAAAGELVWVRIDDEGVLADELRVCARDGAVPSLAVTALGEFIEESWGPSASD